jgi:hypothetical protein
MSSLTFSRLFHSSFVVYVPPASAAARYAPLNAPGPPRTATSEAMIISQVFMSAQRLGTPTGTQVTLGPTPNYLGRPPKCFGSHNQQN